MIVSADGIAVNRTVTTGAATMIVSTTGTAHAKKGKVAAVMRFIRRTVYRVSEIFAYVNEQGKSVFMATKSGKPTSIDPPSKVSF